MNPIRLKLDGKQTKTMVTLTNRSDNPLVLQITPMSWQQKGKKNIYKDTHEVLVTPPIVTIPAGEKQIVRVGLRAPLDPSQEHTYRIFFEEVPTQSQTKNALRMILKIGVPLFVTAHETQSEPLQTTVTTQDNKAHVSLLNVGKSHIQIHKISLTPKGEDKAIVEKTIFHYILPQQSYDIDLDLPRSYSGTQLEASIETDQG